MKDELIISAYGSHNAAVAMYYKGTYTVIEVERWLSKKNAGLINYLPAAYPKIIFDEISEFLLSKTDRSDVDVYLTNYNDLNKLKPAFNYHKHLNFDHHEAHAATAFYQSPYEEAITFTFDGGGDLGFFNVYKTSRQGGIQLLERFNQDLGFAYMILADHMTDIRRDPLNIGNLVYAGKLMGLCSYGNVREKWLKPLHEFYETFNYMGDSYLGGAEAAVDAIPKLMAAIGVEDFTKSTRFEGQFAWDLAATTQHVFEEQFFKFTRKYLDQYPDMPITMSGGCALNVILNTRLLEERNGKVFVPPNPSDCGVAVGGLLLHQRPESQVDLTYSGTPILDSHMFASYVENGHYHVVENVSVSDLASFIALGNIVGVINGNSEHGPRALGNRSIICNPIGDMKDVLNAKVKDREWYRPFAPIVRLEDATTYFDFPEGAQSRHMTYISEVRREWRDTIPAVTHEDGTGRIQTVTEQQNPFIYELLTQFSEISDHSVLLNTSFNVNGKPILTRLSEALEILRDTQLDAVYYEEKLIFRKGDEEKYTRNIISENIKPLDDTTTMYLLAFPETQSEFQTDYLVNMQKMVEEHEQVVVVCPQTFLNIFQNALGDDVTYYPIADNMLYYHEMIQAAIPDISMTAAGFRDLVKILWIKPIMHKNYYRTQNHMFVSMDEFSDDLFSEVKLIAKLATEADRIVVKGKPYTGLFDDDTVKKYTGRKITIPEESPSFGVIWGSIEQIEWLSVNYEGSFLALMREGVVGVDTDYALLTYIQHMDRFKVC